MVLFVCQPSQMYRMNGQIDGDVSQSTLDRSDGDPSDGGSIGPIQLLSHCICRWNSFLNLLRKHFDLFVKLASRNASNGISIVSFNHHF